MPSSGSTPSKSRVPARWLNSSSWPGPGQCRRFAGLGKVDQVTYAVSLLLRPSPSRPTRLTSAGGGQLRMIAPGDSPHTGRSCGHDSSRRHSQRPLFGKHPRDRKAAGQLGYVAVGTWNGHPDPGRANRRRPVPRETRLMGWLRGPRSECGSRAS